MFYGPYTLADTDTKAVCYPDILPRMPVVGTVVDQ